MSKITDSIAFKSFLSLVRSGMWGSKESVSEETDWSVIAQWTRQQTIIPVIAEGIKLSCPQNREQENVSAIFSSSDANSRVHPLLDNTAVKIYSSLQREGIPSVLIKGQGVARYYRSHLLRQCGDVDLLVGSSKYVKLQEFLQRKGYMMVSSSSKHTDFYLSDVRVELHRTCVETSSSTINSFFLKWGDEQVESSSNSFAPAASEVSVRIPEDEFNAIYVFVHMVSALFSSGTGLRQLCDLAAVLDHSRQNLNREIILNSLTSHKMLHIWQVFGCVLVDMMGLSVEAFPFYEEKYRAQAKKLVGYIIEGGNFGFFHKRPQGRRTIGSRISYLWRRTRWKMSLLNLFPESIRKFQ